MKKNNPEWVCVDCGERYGRRLPKYATLSMGECGVCGKEKAVTEPRDYGHLTADWQDQFALVELEKMALAARRVA